jgi:hypothetical protein
VGAPKLHHGRNFVDHATKPHELRVRMLAAAQESQSQLFELKLCVALHQLHDLPRQNHDTVVVAGLGYFRQDAHKRYRATFCVGVLTSLADKSCISWLAINQNDKGPRFHGDRHTP